MGNSAEYAVPKDRETVTVRLDRGIVLEGEIFLEYSASELPKHQKIIAFLDNENAFFPIRISAAKGAEFIGKKSVFSVEVSLSEGREAEFFSGLLLRSIPVTALFRDGATIRGELVAEVPQEKARLSDCLNMPSRFLSVKTERKMCYINKDALQRVVHAESGNNR